MDNGYQNLDIQQYSIKIRASSIDSDDTKMLWSIALADPYSEIFEFLPCKNGRYRVRH